MAEWTGPRIAGVVVGAGGLTVGSIMGLGHMLPCFLVTPTTAEERAKCDAERAASRNAKTLSVASAALLLVSLFGPPVVNALSSKHR